MLDAVLQQVSTPPAIHIGKIAVDYSAYLQKYLSKNIHLVGDVHTLAALPSALPYPTLCFPHSPKANMQNIEEIRTATASADALVAVGSGTLNDLTKYASFLDKKPYAVIATAPSMNGYVSANASIADDAGYKHTLPAHSPRAVLADLDVLAAAPTALIQAGIGDTLCRSTVQADWLLSHFIMGTPYEPKYFEWMKPVEEELLALLNRASARREAWGERKRGEDSPHINNLFTALIISGLAMRDAGNSMPASQGEHMIAHCREMLFPQLPSHYHGLEIAVTSVTMAKRQEKILNSSQAPRIHYAHPNTAIPPNLLRESEAQYFTKLPFQAYVGILNQSLAENWDYIRNQLLSVMLPSKTLAATLTAAGCPTRPEHLGWDAQTYAECATAARFTRNRFTFLDLLPQSH